MANQDHLRILEQGKEVWNRWRQENPTVRPDLKRLEIKEADFNGIDFRDTDLSGVYLKSANLSGADLRRSFIIGAHLRNANLRSADMQSAIVANSDLTYADLRDANLLEADFRRAKFNEANLSELDLENVNMSGSYLLGTYLYTVKFGNVDLAYAIFDNTHVEEADFAGARLNHTIFVNIDFRGVKGLKDVEHLGPSSIDIDSIFRSRGEIQEQFLKGAGIPDIIIDYMGSLVGKAIEYYSAFISYSSQEEELAGRIYNDLQGNGVRCWLAKEDLKIGDKFRITIEESIRIHDKLLLILSENSIRSKWVKYEVENALDMEVEQDRLVLFPIRIDDAVMEADEIWVKRLKQSRHIGDFRGWKEHDKYKEAFSRLLRDLKAET